MSHVLEMEIEGLKRGLVAVAGIVEESLLLAARALQRRDMVLARQVIDKDSKIDRLEVQLEEECLKVLALHQPVAQDLRMIVAILKINNDLERIGDLASNIAERAETLAQHDPIAPICDFETMVERTRQMLKQSLDALCTLDVSLAREVRAMDNLVDDMNRLTYTNARERARQFPDQIEPLMCYLSVSRNLERIADLATNISEDVVYLIDGKIVRHRVKAEKAATIQAMA
jgi:phosphate transport system protein